MQKPPPDVQEIGAPHLPDLQASPAQQPVPHDAPDGEQLPASGLAASGVDDEPSSDASRVDDASAFASAGAASVAPLLPLLDPLLPLLDPLLPLLDPLLPLLPPDDVLLVDASGAGMLGGNSEEHARSKRKSVRIAAFAAEVLRIIKG